MSRAELERMLPSGSSFGRLCDLINFYTSKEFFWDLQLVLAREDVPVIQLGKSGRLGWNTWLKTKPFEFDPEDLILAPSSN